MRIAEKTSLPENIKVSVKVEKRLQKLWLTLPSKAHYEQFGTNAVQAMPNGGKLSIHAYREENDIVLTVEDTGVGIPEEVKCKLFTPMFTTKAKGQGFGLASC